MFKSYQMDLPIILRGYYQTVRPHTFNNYLTPAETERRYFNKTSYRVS
jgi:putative transposase